ncbi:MAG: hypothetical protein GEU79_14040, partial [Acidimicrobiia bacterium]|nr:hypothetical protein [Acidimicrobiia bacterium]
MTKLIALFAALAMVLAACGGGTGNSDGGGAADDGAETASAEPVSDPTITITDMEFSGGTITVEAGTK